MDLGIGKRKQRWTDASLSMAISPSFLAPSADAVRAGHSPILPPLHTRAASEGEKPVFSMLDISNEFHSLLAFHLQTDLGGRIGKCCRTERFKELLNMCIVQVN
jgi:hypothetical protein